MSQYNKTVLTRAGLELAKKANAGQAKFGITRAVTSADDWSGKTTQDLEEVTAIPNIMQQGTIMDAEEVESNNSVIGVSLRFTNKDLSTGYQIRVIGLYVKEEGQDKDFLYAVTTAVTPEYMPGFGDKVLYRFNMQMYLVIGKAQAVNVVIDEGTAVTHGQFDKYKGELNEDLKKIENTHKEDMSHVVKSASINGGAEILPNEAGKLELVVPNPDLSKYVSLEQLKELLNAKADVTAIPDKIDTENGIKEAKAAAKAADDKAQSALDEKADKTEVYTKSNIDDMHSKTYFRKKGMDQNGNAVEIRTNAVKQSNGGYAIDIYDTDWTAAKLRDALPQIASLNAAKDGIQKEAPDFNTLTDSGNYYVTNTSDATNAPSSSWGILVVWHGTGARIEQLYYPDNGDAPFYRMNSGGNWLAWKQIANKDDIQNLRNTLGNQANDINARLPLAGGTMNSNAEISFNNDAVGKQGGLTWNGSTDSAKIYGDVTANDNFDLAFDLGDDGSNHFSFRKNGTETAGITSDGKFTGRIDWNHVNGLTDPNVTAGKIANHDTRLNTLEQNQFEVQTFTDATAAANWEAQKPGHRLAIINK